jgi:antitoxin component YwqK of YwqJK toxin-antitoxin module
MGASWYVEKNGKRSGPFTPAQLKGLVASGRLQATDMVQNDGMEKAVLAGKVKGLFPAILGLPATLPPTVAPARSGPKTAGSPDDQQKQASSGSRNDLSAGPAAPSLRGRFARLPGWQKSVAVLGVLMIGSCLISTIAGVVMVVIGVKPTSPVVSKENGKAGEPADKEGAKQGTESLKTPDFSNVDYTFDFSKVDYSPPADMKGASRSGFVKEVPQNEDQEEKGKWERVEGYEDPEGKFVRHGRRTLWFDMDQKDKYKDQQWFKDKRHGAQQQWYKGGQISWQGAFVDGELHGILTIWHNNGQKAKLSHWIRGKSHGTSEFWYKDGQREQEETLIDGQLNGIQRKWWPNGKMREETECVRGDNHGKYARWNEEGTKICDGEFDHGNATGAWRFGFLPRGNRGALYYVTIKEGVSWSSGTKAEFLGRLVNHAVTSNFIIYPREGECHCIVSYKWFLETFGKPQQDRGSDQFMRQWTYRCSDGTLVFRAGVDPNQGIVNLNTQ